MIQFSIIYNIYHNPNPNPNRTQRDTKAELIEKSAFSTAVTGHKHGRFPDSSNQNSCFYICKHHDREEILFLFVCKFYLLSLVWEV